MVATAFTATGPSGSFAASIGTKYSHTPVRALSFGSSAVNFLPPTSNVTLTPSS